MSNGNLDRRNLDAALEYAGRGWRLIPLHDAHNGMCSCGRSDCSSPGKHPRTISGLLGASSDSDQLIDWFRDRWPGANLGVATGAGSNLVVVDFDGTEGLMSMNRLGISSSTSVSTARGMHLYFTFREGVKNSSQKLGPGVDVRGEGGYVLVPPSRHPSGSLYAWLSQGKLDPYPLLERAQSASESAPVVPGAGVKVSQGARNEIAFRLASKMRGQIGLDEDAILAAASVHNQKWFSPPLEDAELRAAVHSGSRYLPSESASRIWVPDSSDALEVTTARSFLGQPETELDEILGPLIVRGYRLLIAGHTGEGKTTLALQLVRAVVESGEFLEWKGTGGRALIVDAEQGQRTIRRRFVEAKLSGDDIDLVRVPDGISLDKPEEAAQLEEVIAKGNYDVVLLDPFYKLHEGDMTKEFSVVPLMRKLDEWRDHYNFALILTAHCRKPILGIPMSIHDIHGHGSVTRGAEVVIGIERKQGGESRLHYMKDRDGDLRVSDSVRLSFDRLLGFQAWSA